MAKSLIVNITAIHCFYCRKLKLVLLNQRKLTIKKHTQRILLGLFEALRV